MEARPEQNGLASRRRSLGELELAFGPSGRPAPASFGRSARMLVAQG